jgi:pyridoxine 4-dehydrogenase
MRTALSLGANNWNGGELYGTPERNSLHLLNEYFTKYPGDADEVVLSIKGGLVPGQMKPDGSKTGVRRSIDECLRVLDGKKSLDLFEMGALYPFASKCDFLTSCSTCSQSRSRHALRRDNSR